jgi:hypothetical protein
LTGAGFSNTRNYWKLPVLTHIPTAIFVCLFVCFVTALTECALASYCYFIIQKLKLFNYDTVVTGHLIALCQIADEPMLHEV